MKPPPPMLPAVGWVTAMAKPVAIAASMALPPFLITSKPIWEAMSLWVMTRPSRARCGTEPACSVRDEIATVAISRTNVRRIMESLRRELYGSAPRPPHVSTDFTDGHRLEFPPQMAAAHPTRVGLPDGLRPLARVNDERK